MIFLLSFLKAYNFPVVFTRAANVYGPGQQLYRIIPRTILSCLTGKKLFLHGGGTSTRSFIHIDDVCKSVELMIKKQFIDPINITSGKKINLINVCKIINKLYIVIIIKSLII